MTMTYVGAQRLADHCTFLAGVPDIGFHMENWWTDVITGSHSDTPPQRQDANCGTAACVAGWLPISKPEDWYGPKGDLPRLRNIPHISVMDAFAYYFQMSVNEAEYICYNYKYDLDVSRQDAIEHMQHVASVNGWDISSGQAIQIKEKSNEQDVQSGMDGNQK